MIEIDRREVLRFRALVKRCMASRPRGIAPPVVFTQGEDGLTLSAVLDETVIALQLPAGGKQALRLVVSFSVLAAVDGPGGGVITLEVVAGGKVQCRWQDRGEPKELTVDPVPPEAGPPPLPPLAKLHPVDPSLPEALHACGQSASREKDGRYALLRLQLRGASGEVVGTDGRQLLLWGGFAFPFQEDLLIPAVPVFGSRELAGEEDVRIGRTAKHIAVAVGPVTIWLAIDGDARFPDVTMVIPRSSRVARLLFDDADATLLTRDLQKAEPSPGEVKPIVLDLGAQPTVTWPDRNKGPSRVLSLARSSCSGPATAVQLDPKYLLRALSLGFREVRIISAHAPIVFHDENRTFLLANFGSAPAPAPPERPALPGPEPKHALSTKGVEVMNSERNGGPPNDPSPSDEILDPMTEGEALRAALAEVGRRFARLMTSLRNLQKQRRAFNAAWTSLKHLGIGNREEP